AGLLSGLSDSELFRLVNVASSRAVPGTLAFRTALLEAYYLHPANKELSSIRQQMDRCLIYREGDRVSAQDLVEQMNHIFSNELGRVQLGLLGDESPPPIVLKSGKDFIRVIEMEAQGDPSTLSLRSLVRAFNSLLSLRETRKRFLPLQCAEWCEIYYGLSLTEATELARDGWLEEKDLESVIDFGGW
ncbi:MAG: hypothetical protein RMJ84_13325, partial [Sandaracinaceae bacterium]|nr:hypothetical protein [Sandaracinaceae bacterium]